MIQIKNLTKKYGATLILDHAQYTFPAKGMVCLMSPSGGGKTTLFNVLAGFDTDYEGQIIVGGTVLGDGDATALCAYRRDNIGFVFQDYHLLTGYTVLENVLLACELGDDSTEHHLPKARSLLARLGLREKENQKCETLSGGQKQRVAIARALMGDPQIIFADEPTGALDRQASTEIMTLLREISADKLVVVITHDGKICDFADEIIEISQQKIVVKQAALPTTAADKPLIVGKAGSCSALTHGRKNFTVHFKRHLAIALAISLGMLAFLFSLSFSNVMDQAIDTFQEKNTAFNSGYIKGTDDGTILAYLQADNRIGNAYYQYKLHHLTLSLGAKTEQIAEKFPGAKATESLSYGVMPRRGANEIALTPSLAKKFASDIKSLLGQELTFTQGGQTYTLTLSGIFNAGYDDFFVSADVEQQLYEGLRDQENYAISYEVTNFADIVAVNNGLELRGLTTKTAADDVYALQSTFRNLHQLFRVISGLVLGICLFICAVLLVRLQNSRYHEVGLLSTLGFRRHQISALIAVENALLAMLAALVTFLLLSASTGLAKLLRLPFTVTSQQFLLTVVVTFAVVMLLSGLASYKLLRTEPAQALRK